MSKRRVVVTGFGMITPLGLTTQESWTNILNGVSGVSCVDEFDVTDYPTKIWARVKHFSPEAYFDVKEARKMDAFSQYGVVAADDALKQSGLVIDSDNAH